jgi:hypothetical protein
MPAVFCHSTTARDDFALIEQPIDLLEGQVCRLGITEILTISEPIVTDLRF